MDQSPLMVPIVVEALVVNESVRLGTTPSGYGFQRLAMAYGELAQFQSAWPGEPDLMTMGTPQEYDGVYLKWRLPEALTRGVVEGDATTFPLVPNRWLVVRWWQDPPAARQAAAWIVESDAPNDTVVAGSVYSSTGSTWVAHDSPPDSPPGECRIGASVPLTGTPPWTEPGTPPFLTAVGPGNPTFAVFQPACNNVFSFFDALYDLGVDPQPLTYCVVGWYSDPAYDPLAAAGASPDAFAEVLRSLNWAVEEARGSPGSPPAGASASWALYTGFVLGVQWQTTSFGPSAVPGQPIGISFGNNSAEALTNLVAGQGAGDPELQPELLQALQLGALHLLDQPGGEVLLDERVQAAQFRKRPGGHAWTLVPRAGGGEPPAAAVELCAALNDAHAALDAAGRLLESQREQLYVAWWKWASLASAFQFPIPPPPGVTSAWLETQMDAGEPGTPAAAVAESLAQVQALEALVLELAGQVSAFAEGELRKTALPHFFAPTEPVVLLSGAGASGIVANSPDPLVCRFPGQLVSGFWCGGTLIAADGPGAPPAGALAVPVPLPDLAAAQGVPWSPADVALALNECYLLDPLSAPAIAAAVQGQGGPAEAEVAVAMADPVAFAAGTLPPGYYAAAGGSPGKAPPQQWRQNPWHPLFINWAGAFAPIGYGAGWSFDGSGYQWGGGSVPEGGSTLSGQVVLTPAASVNLSAQIQALLQPPGYQGSPGSPGSYEAELYGLAELQEYIRTSDAWDLVSQSLDGFNEQLLLRANGAFLSPAAVPFTPPGGGPSVQELLGPAGGRPLVTTADDFQYWRSGYFQFTQLSVIDEWGQSLFLVAADDPTQVTFPATVPTSSPQAPLLLAPTLLQPGRLAFQLLEDGGASPGAPPAPVDPGGAIRGWVLPNLLDRSFLVYDARGSLLGEVAAGAADHLCWFSGATGSPWPSPDGSPEAVLHAQAGLVEGAGGDPWFAEFVGALLALSPDSFQAFFTAVDAVLGGMPPPDATFNHRLGLLVGYPLAFVRATLQLELDGPALADPSWDATLQTPPSPPTVTTWPFPVRLGNVSQARDGLVGYFAADDYAVFNVVPVPGIPDDPYLAPIGANGEWIDLCFGDPAGGAPPPVPATVSLLLDPRLPVHALTGILPAASVRVPPAEVDAALRRMSVTFRVDTLLTDQDAAGAVPMPLPTSAGSWSWIETADGVETAAPAVAAAPDARLSGVPPLLRRGLLRLSEPFSTGSPPTPTLVRGRVP